MYKNEIPDNDLENVSAGYVEIAGYGSNSLKLSQEAYNELEKGGFIVDGKLTISNGKALKYLEEKGYYRKPRLYTGLIPPTKEQEKFFTDFINQRKNSKK